MFKTWKKKFRIFQCLHVEYLTYVARQVKPWQFKKMGLILVHDQWIWLYLYERKMTVAARTEQESSLCPTRRLEASFKSLLRMICPETDLRSNSFKCINKCIFMYNKYIVRYT